MAEFNIRSDAVDVERIMEQIRSRIREKRGVDYTEEQIRELANVKLERFLDPRNVRSDLLAHYREQRAESSAAAGEAADAFDLAAVPAFEPDDVYRSSRGGVGWILRTIRRLLRPVLKLFINPGPLLEAVRGLGAHADGTGRALSRVNAGNRARAELDALTYEVLNNLVVEMTRLAIDLKNHKMRVESVAARLDFDERRARALEEIVQYRAAAASGAASPATGGAAAPAGADGGETGPEKRRRRRRRGRRRAGSGTAAAGETAPDTAGGNGSAGQGAGGGAAPAAAGGEPRAQTSPGAAGGPAGAAAGEPRSDSSREPRSDSSREPRSDSSREPRSDSSREPTGEPRSDSSRRAAGEPAGDASES